MIVQFAARLNINGNVRIGNVAYGNNSIIIHLAICLLGGINHQAVFNTPKLLHTFNKLNQAFALFEFTAQVR